MGSRRSRFQDTSRSTDASTSATPVAGRRRTVRSCAATGSTAATILRRVTATGRSAVVDLGLAAVVDLRQHLQFSARQVSSIRRPRSTGHSFDRVIDMDDPPPLTRPAAHHRRVRGDDRAQPDQIGEVLGIIGDRVGSGPVLVLTARSANPTGIIVALVQAAIGVPSESIADEYHRSDEPSRRRRDRMLAEPLTDDPPIHRPPAYLFSAPRRSMELLLERGLDAHGTLMAWFDSFPVPPGTAERLRAGLLVPA